MKVSQLTYIESMKFMSDGGNASFAALLLGWRKTDKGKLFPNNADSNSVVSTRIAKRILETLNPDTESPYIPGQTDMGRPLEESVKESLRAAIPMCDPSRGWKVESRSVNISEFVQFEHLKKVDKLVKNSPELRTTLGVDYLIKPDVTVTLPARNPGESEFLHAAISCKWTIRSDRVQNIRHEFNQMIRHRRERLPHLITVTAEPLPTRLASIARGTGEVDAVYHIAFDSLDAAVREDSLLSQEQKRAWDEVTEQGRVRPYSDLPKTIALW